RRPPVGVVLDALRLERGVLGIGLQHRVVLELVVRREIEPVARHEVLVVDLRAAQQVPDELLARLDVLRELPDADVARRVRLVAAAWPARRPVVVDGVTGRELHLLGHDVGAHRIVDPAGLALLDRLVVAGVVPGEDLGLHAVLEHLPVPLDQLRGLRAVDPDGLAVLVDLHAAERPQNGPGRRDRVEILVDGDPDRVPHLLDLDAGVFGEALADLGQLLVGERGEVVPAQVRDLALLAPRRRHAGGEDAGEAGARGGRQETSSSDRGHDSFSFLWFNRPAAPRRWARLVSGHLACAWGMLLEDHVEPGDQHHQMGSPRRPTNTRYRRANLIRTTSYPNSPRRSRRLNYPEPRDLRLTAAHRPGAISPRSSDVAHEATGCLLPFGFGGQA